MARLDTAGFRGIRSAQPLIIVHCPFVNLPEASSGRWGQGLTPEKMKKCIWVRPELVARFEFLEWTGTYLVWHIRFVAMPRRSVS
jgi:hypothetical protein